MTVILSIDPGGLRLGETGIAVGYIDDTTPYELVDTYAVPDNLDGFRMWYYALVPGRTYDVVVCEKWVDRNIPGADRSAMLIEGAVRFMWPKVVLQPASGKNTAVSDLVLKRLGAYTAGGHHHDILEATRHGVWYCKKQRHLPTLRKGWQK